MAIINDNDMEIILKGSESETIRHMLDNRFFSLIQMPKKKPERVTSPASSSVFVCHLNDWLNTTFAIRGHGSNVKYEDCENYLRIYRDRGIGEESKRIYEQGLRVDLRKCQGTVRDYSTDEVVDFLKDKDLVLISAWVEKNGDMESCKVGHFLNDSLLFRKECGSKFVLNDDFYDVRIFLRRRKRKGEKNANNEDHLTLADIRSLDLNDRLRKIIQRARKREYSDEGSFQVVFETQSDRVQASYLAMRFHSNTLWKADPVCILNFRISAFVLPGAVTVPGKVRKGKLAKNLVTGEQFVIDSIHFNSDICEDVGEFDELMKGHFYDFGLA